MNLFDKEYGIVKFVCVNNEYRFCNHWQDHISLVVKGETAQSAGFIYYSDGTFKIPNEYSMTLNHLGPKDDDGLNIAKLINMTLKENYC